MRRLIARLAPRPGRDETGAAATLVAVLLGGGVLLGMAAITVDVGRLYTERRQVQNGADAAALGLAVDCSVAATCDTSSGGAARTLANANANDGATTVLSVCGSGAPGLGGCGGSGGPMLTQCPAPPSGVQGWVRVRTGTSAAGGGSLLPPVFAQALAGNGGYAGTQVLACAQAAWGSAASMAVMVPVTLSMCEWDAATSGGTAFAAQPPYPPYPSGEVALKLHSTSERGGCPSSGGAYGDLPGGFGWLAAGSGCTALNLSAGGTVAADPGVSASSCADLVSASVGKVLFLPVYSAASGSGANGTYQIAGFAAFYLSGYNLPGAHPTKVASPVGGHLCNGSDKCLYGWFTQALVPTPSTIGSGPPMGARVVALVG